MSAASAGFKDFITFISEGAMSYSSDQFFQTVSYKAESMDLGWPQGWRPDSLEIDGLTFLYHGTSSDPDRTGMQWHNYVNELGHTAVVVDE